MTGGGEFRIRGKTYTGKTWIEEENICLLREQYFGSLKSCDEIYRNPERDNISKTEYFRVTDYGLYGCTPHITFQTRENDG